MASDLTYLGKRSRFVYGATGSETDWTMGIPIRAWGRSTPTVGGSRTAAGGTPASYIVRRDHLLSLPLRFRESEWEDLHGVLAWGQASESFEWYPDALDPATSFTVYLISPAAGEEIEPQRSAEYPKLLELTVELRRVDNEIWTLDFHA